MRSNLSKFQLFQQTLNRTKIITLSHKLIKKTKQYKCMINIRNAHLFSYPKIIVLAQKHKNNINNNVYLEMHHL